MSPDRSSEFATRPARGVRPALRREMHLSDALLVIRKKKWLVIGCTVLGLALAIAATTLMQRRYSSTVTIEVHKEGNGLSLEDLSGVGQELIGGDQLSVDLLTQQAEIGNENIAIKVLEDKDLHLTEAEPFNRLGSAFERGTGNRRLDFDPEYRDSAVRLFQSRLKINIVKGTRLITVTYTDANPRTAANVANAVVDEYLLASTQQRYTATSKTSAWLRTQLSDLKDRVTTSQKHVDEFKQKQGFIGTPAASLSRDGASEGLSSIELGRFSSLNSQLTSAEASRIAAEAIYHLSQSDDADVVLGIESSQLNGGVAGVPVLDVSRLRQLRTEAGQLDLQRSADVLKYGAKNPVIEVSINQVKEVNRQIKEEIVRIGKQASRNLEVARSTEDGLRQSVEHEKSRLGRLTSTEDELLPLEQEEISSRTLYQTLYGKLEAANILAGAKSANITIVNEARAPAGPSRPNPVQNAALGFLAGLFIGLFLAFGIEYQNDLLTTPEDLLVESQIPLLGLVPKAGGRQRRAYGASEATEAAAGTTGLFAWVLRSPKSAVSEACRQIRTSILLSRSTCPRTLLFTSPLSGDGKSTLTSNMAFTFALQGNRVLLVDCDMRRPTLHTRLDLTNERGLSQCLTSDIDPTTVIQPHPAMGEVHVLTSGPIPPAPSELLGSSRFKSLLAWASEHYDFVFLDSPPVLLVTDAVLISTMVDGVILIVRSGVTRKGPFERALQMLSHSQNHLLGTILNAADVRGSDFGGGYKYYVGNAYYGDSHE